MTIPFVIPLVSTKESAANILQRGSGELPRYENGRLRVSLKYEKENYAKKP